MCYIVELFGAVESVVDKCSVADKCLCYSCLSLADYMIVSLKGWRMCKTREKFVWVFDKPWLWLIICITLCIIIVRVIGVRVRRSCFL